MEWKCLMHSLRGARGMKEIKENGANTQRLTVARAAHTMVLCAIISRTAYTKHTIGENSVILRVSLMFVS